MATRPRESNQEFDAQAAAPTTSVLFFVVSAGDGAGVDLAPAPSPADTTK